MPRLDTIMIVEAIRMKHLLKLLSSINGMTEDTNPDGAADFVMSYDNSASAHRKVLMDNLPGGGGGGSGDSFLEWIGL